MVAKNKKANDVQTQSEKPQEATKAQGTQEASLGTNGEAVTYESILKKLELQEKEIKKLRDDARVSSLRMNALLSKYATSKEIEDNRAIVVNAITRRRMQSALRRSGDPKAKVYEWNIKDNNMEKPYKFPSTEASDPKKVKKEYEESTGRSWTGGGEDPLEVNFVGEMVTAK